MLPISNDSTWRNLSKTRPGHTELVAPSTGKLWVEFFQNQDLEFSDLSFESECHFRPSNKYWVMSKGSSMG